MTPGRIWRRTAIERNGRLAPLTDDWSLWDAASGIAIARIHAEPDGGWRCVCRLIVDGIVGQHPIMIINQCVEQQARQQHLRLWLS